MFLRREINSGADFFAKVTVIQHLWYLKGQPLRYTNKELTVQRQPLGAASVWSDFWGFATSSTSIDSNFAANNFQGKNSSTMSDAKSS